MESNEINVSALEKLILQHTEIWDVNTRTYGMVSKVVLDEIRKEGESRIDIKIVSKLLLSHEGLIEFGLDLENGWCCQNIINEISELLLSLTCHEDDIDANDKGKNEKTTESIRLTRKDWFTLLELILSNDIGWIYFDKCDFTEWPSFIKQLINARNIQFKKKHNDKYCVPSLTSICARMITREKQAYHINDNLLSLKPDIIKLIEQASHGILFNSSNMNGHDPIYKFKNASLSLNPNSYIRIASRCETWPYRLFSFNNKVLTIPQGIVSPNEIGTGSCVWGAALAMCEVMEQRGSSWMEGERRNIYIYA